MIKRPIVHSVDVSMRKEGRAGYSRTNPSTRKERPRAQGTQGIQGTVEIPLASLSSAQRQTHSARSLLQVVVIAFVELRVQYSTAQYLVTVSQCLSLYVHDSLRIKDYLHVFANSRDQRRDDVVRWCDQHFCMYSLISSTCASRPTRTFPYR